jgi:hyperosmotically inducible protein
MEPNPNQGLVREEPIMHTAMQTLTRSFNIILIIILLGMIFTASGCSKSDDEGVTVGQKVDRAIDQTNAAAAQTNRELQAAAQKADDKVHEDAQKAKDAFHDETASRTSGEVSSVGDDAAITASIKADILKDPDLSVLKVDVSTDKGEVTLRGKVNTPAARRRAEQLASAVDGVHKVNNELQVASNGKPGDNA